jgi:hypothetical protein
MLYGKAISKALWLAALAAVTVTGSAGSALAADPVLDMSAVAVNMSGVGRVRAQNLQITIERWSTDAERNALMDTIVEKGVDHLLDAVKKITPRAGYIRTGTSLGWAIQFARYEDLPNGGKRVIFATDRPMSLYELQNNTRSSDYDFMLCEIRLGPDGKGEGKLATAAKVSYDREKRQLEIENYGNEPVRLTQVMAAKK